jgi:hypothetical protein
MKNTLRLFGLVTALSLSVFSNVHAATGCSIRCSNGQTYHPAASSGSACCSQIDVLCPSGGSGSYNGQACAL